METLLASEQKIVHFKIQYVWPLFLLTSGDSQQAPPIHKTILGLPNISLKCMASFTSLRTVDTFIVLWMEILLKIYIWCPGNKMLSFFETKSCATLFNNLCFHSTELYLQLVTKTILVYVQRLEICPSGTTFHSIINQLTARDGAFPANNITGTSSRPVPVSCISQRHG